MFDNLDFKGFWKDSAESKKDFICSDFTNEDIIKCENKLGFKLPLSYIKLLEHHNGGILGKNIFQKINKEGKVVKLVICDFLNAIGDEKRFSLLGDWSKWIKEGYKSGILFGLNMPNSGYATNFYLDYSLCGSQGEPRVIAHTKVFRDNTTRHIEIELADTFEDFVKGLVKKPVLKPFDFNEFEIILKKVAKETFEYMINQHPKEQFSGFGFYLNDEASMVATAMNTKSHLDELLLDSPTNKEFLTYSTANWKYEGIGNNESCNLLSEKVGEYSIMLLTDSNRKKFRKNLINSCVSVLAELREENYFEGKYMHKLTLMVNTTTDDLTDKEYKKIIHTLT